jgi:hypothetical protein
MHPNQIGLLLGHKLVRAHATYHGTLQYVIGNRNSHSIDGTTHICTRHLHATWLHECREAIPTATTPTDCRELELLFPKIGEELWLLRAHLIKITTDIGDLSYVWNEVITACVQRKKTWAEALKELTEIYEHAKVLMTDIKTAKQVFEMVYRCEDQRWALSEWILEIRKKWDELVLKQIPDLKTAQAARDLWRDGLPSEETHGAHKFQCTARAEVNKKFLELWVAEVRALKKGQRESAIDLDDISPSGSEFDKERKILMGIIHPK